MASHPPATRASRQRARSPEPAVSPRSIEPRKFQAEALAVARSEPGGGPPPAHDFGQLPAAQLAKEPDNRTGMPDRLKSGLEQLSGRDLSSVRVHRNSDKPAQVQALAYTQGRDIHVAPGQERHLPHEGWHAVQQMEGRVRPTVKAHGVAINDDHGLEREADVMGRKALQTRRACEHEESS